MLVSQVLIHCRILDPDICMFVHLAVLQVQLTDVSLGMEKHTISKTKQTSTNWYMDWLSASVSQTPALRTLGPTPALAL